MAAAASVSNSTSTAKATNGTTPADVEKQLEVLRQDVTELTKQVADLIGQAKDEAMAQVKSQVRSAKSQVNSAQFTLQAANSDAETTLQTVVVNVQQAYFTLQQQQRLVTVSEEALTQFQKHLDLAKGRFRAGVAPKIDVTTAEVDLSNALATRMGRTARFVQNQWDGLVPGLERGEYDAVINGLEVTPERAEKIHFSIPYFYSTLTITTRADDHRVQRADDLRGLTVGVLRVTFAERYVQSLGNIMVRSYDGQVPQFLDLALARLDAVVMDTPVALYYATGPEVRNIEIPASQMAFGIGSLLAGAGALIRRMRH